MKFDTKQLAAGLSEDVVAKVLPHLPPIDLREYPDLNGYSWEQCHEGFMGSGGLFLVSELAGQLGLKPGDRVLDLGAGRCAGSVFLAKHYGVRVFSIDKDIEPTDCWETAARRSVGDLVLPLSLDARALPFPHDFFDSVISINSYMYFGTDDAYLPYLCKFLKPNGAIAIANPCYARELEPDTPTKFLYDRPDFIESRTCHSPGWWKHHFSKSGLVDVLHCAEHPKGRELWLDDLRFSLLQQSICEMTDGFRNMITDDLAMLLSDEERFITYFTLLARKRPIAD